MTYTLSESFLADAAEYLIERPDGLLIFDDVAVFGRDCHEVKILHGDVEEGILL
jgi:hypothetical protein